MIINQKIESLNARAIEIAARYHRAESELIDILRQIDDERAYMHYDCSSLFAYALKVLKLSEACASNFITVARKSKNIPALIKAIESCELSVSKARKITAVLTNANSGHWLELAKTLPRLKLEKEVAKVMPQTATIERAKYVAENRIELKLGVSEELLKKLRRAQDLTSQKTKKAASLEDTLSEILSVYLQKQDPLEKAERNLKGARAQTVAVETPVICGALASVPGHTPKQKKAKRYICAKIRHQINLRDQQQCSYQHKNGARCETTRWLEIHHQVPVSQNGSNEISNLKTLCTAHHKQQHLN
jgi:hypothetical protein